MFAADTNRLSLLRKRMLIAFLALSVSAFAFVACEDTDDDGTPDPFATPTTGTGSPTGSPTVDATGSPSGSPTVDATGSPTGSPTVDATGSPTGSPTVSATGSPTGSPTVSATGSPTTGSPTPSGTSTAEPVSSLDVIDETATAIVGANGRPVYVRIDETAENIMCDDETCLENWPPVLTDDEEIDAAGVPTDIGTIEREDGQLQITVDGQPIYYFFGDSEGSNIPTGQGFLDLWYVIDPLGNVVMGDVVDEEISGTATPAIGTGSPTPGTGTGSPTPGTGTGSPTPGTGTGSPTPGTGTGSPTPSTGIGSPTPGTGTGAGQTSLHTRESDLYGELIYSVNNKPVYVLPGETADSLQCTAECLNEWEPVYEADITIPIEGIEAEVDTVARDEGQQVTLNGMPIYTYTADTEDTDSPTGQFVPPWALLAPSGSTSP